MNAWTTSDPALINSLCSWVTTSGCSNTTSGTTVFDKNFAIDEIIEEAYERIGMQGVSGNQLRQARRSLNIMFQEWGNRGLHYWEVANNSITLVSGQAE